MTSNLKFDVCLACGSRFEITSHHPGLKENFPDIQVGSCPACHFGRRSLTGRGWDSGMIRPRAAPPAKEGERWWALGQGLTDLLIRMRSHMCGCARCTGELAEFSWLPRGFLRLLHVTEQTRMGHLSGPRPAATARRTARYRAVTIGKGGTSTPPDPRSRHSERNASERGFMLLELATHLVPSVSAVLGAFDSFWLRLEALLETDEGQEILERIKTGLREGTSCFSWLSTIDATHPSSGGWLAHAVSDMGTAWDATLDVMFALADPSVEIDDVIYMGLDQTASLRRGDERDGPAQGRRAGVDSPT